jgi:TPR repeat protein
MEKIFRALGSSTNIWLCDSLSKVWRCSRRQNWSRLCSRNSFSKQGLSLFNSFRNRTLGEARSSQWARKSCSHVDGTPEEPGAFSETVFEELLEKQGRDQALAFAQKFIETSPRPISLSEAKARVAYIFEKYFKRPRKSEHELREIETLLREPAAAGFPQAQYLLGLAYRELAVLREEEYDFGCLPNLRKLLLPSGRESNLLCFLEPLSATPERIADIVKRERAKKEDSYKDESKALYEQSFGNIQRAAEAGMVEAKTALAAFFLYGIPPVEADPPKAIDMMLSSAKEGDPNAHTELANYFRNLNPPNLQKALRHLRLAVGMGDMHAEYEMGVMYIAGELGQEIDYARGIDLLTKAAAKGHPDSHFILARIFCGSLLHEVYDGPISTSNEKFLKHINAAIEAEHAGAMQFLAESIYRGSFNLKRDYPRALKLLFHAAQIHAEERNIDASGDCLYTAGLMIYHGLGTRRDPKHAFFVMQASCESGNLPATRFLSNMYATGDGIEKNEKMARYLAKLSARDHTVQPGDAASVKVIDDQPNLRA